MATYRSQKADNILKLDTMEDDISRLSLLAADTGKRGCRGAERVVRAEVAVTGGQRSQSDRGVAAWRRVSAM